MKRNIKEIILFVFCGLLMSACNGDPEIENLPSPDVAFTYSVTDDSYQLDYYIGSTIQFKSTSSLSGTCTWDFGDGTTATGDIVTHTFESSGTFSVRLSIQDKYNSNNITISDIKPIVSLSVDGTICEVLTNYVSFNVELPNPASLSEEYAWTFPEGTLSESGDTIKTFTGKNPGKIKFSNVGSQTVSLKVKLGGRELDETTKNVQVAYNKEAPTLYYAVAGGNIMAMKLIDNPPAGMKIKPYDLGVKAGQHPLNILFNDSSLYVLDCGKQFTYVNDADGNLGDGRITVVSKDGSKVETMLTNSLAAFDDSFYGFISGSNLYFSDRNTGFASIPLTERNRSFSRTSFPYYVQNATLGYYGLGLSYGAMNAGFAKINNVWYWCKTYNGNGIFRFTDSDILSAAIEAGKGTVPSSGIALSGMSPKSFVWDATRSVFYFSVFDSGSGGLYKCTLSQLDGIGTGNLANYKLTLANGKMTPPIVDAGVGEGSAGEYIGICQMALDSNTGSVYYGFRSGSSDLKSGLMRYNPTTGYIGYLIEGVKVYGVAVNNTKTKLF